MHRRFSIFIAGIVLGGIGVLPTGVLGATVRANLEDGGLSGAVAGTGTMNVAAYSEEMGVINASTSAGTRIGGVTTQFGAGGAASGPGNYLSTKGRFTVPTGRASPKFAFYKNAVTPIIVNSGGSPVNASKSWLATSGDQYFANSSTGEYSGSGTAYAYTSKKTGSLMRGLVATASQIGALPPPPGDAAGYASDPFGVTSGSYTYDPVLDASITLDNPYVSGGLDCFATDGSVFTSDSMDNFDADGAPLADTLWSVSIGGSTPTTSVGSVYVDFELNPVALKEISFSSAFLSPLGSYSDQASEAALIDHAMDAIIEGELSVSGDEIDLSNAEFFPDGTTYSPLSNGEEYEDGVAADIIGVPLPRSVWMGLVCLVGVGVTRLRPRKRVV